MPTAHLISGLPGSGKTTYALTLQASEGASLFSLDRWLITLFGQYSIEAIGHEEHTRRVLACREVIWMSAAELLHRAVDVILDDGFFFREHRMRHIRLAAEVGASTKIHFIDTPLEFVQTRLERRNAALPTYNFRVNVEMLRSFAALFEIPSEQEGVVVKVSCPAVSRC